jgi:hypothetical protein
MVLQKARSRLQPAARKPQETFSTTKESSGPVSLSRRKMASFKWPATFSDNPRILAIWQSAQPFLKRWPQILMGSSVFLALWRLLATYTPSQLAHVIWPNSYLPVLGLWFIAQWYFGSFWLQHSKRGLLWAIIVTTWLYTRLQFIIIPGWFWLSLLGSWLTLELIWKQLHRQKAR